MFGRRIILVVVLFAAFAGGCKRALVREKGLHAVVFPNKWVGDIDRIGFNEPSGIVWHGGRGTLFVVGDEGDICEIKTDGTLVKEAHIRQADFEGITYDPATGLLYLAVEGEEAIVEVDPDTFEVVREWRVPREFEGRLLMREGGEGLEGITFVPDADHAEGGIFYVANQAFVLNNPEDISAIFRVEVPLRSGGEEVRILGYYEPGVIDIAGLNYEAATRTILAVSDAENLLMIYSPDLELVDFYAFPGDNQEGITVDDAGFIYIAQDSGGILKLKWLR